MAKPTDDTTSMAPALVLAECVRLRELLRAVNAVTRWYNKESNR